MPENEDAQLIYSLVQDQFIMSMNGPVAINQNAIYEAMDLYNVEFKKDCFEKVLLLSRHFLKKMKDEQEVSEG